MQDKGDFFRDAEDQEKAWIAANEAILYKRQCKSFIMLIILFAFCLTMGILGLFFPIGLGRLFCIVMIPISIFLVVITAIGIWTTKRQLVKVRNGDYGVQNVTITDVHNEVHGIKSDQHVTFTAENGESYEMNTHTTGDAGLIRGTAGLLVILHGESNILLTSKYRFFPEHKKRKELSI